MARRTTPIDDEKRSYGAVWLVTSLLLFVGALWCIADDNLFRRPWKKFQAEFNRLEIQHLKDAIAAEQQRLDADPAYQQAVKTLADARVSASSGEIARQIADLQRELRRAQQQDQSKDLNLRFVKSELEELRFKYDDALHAGRPTEDLLKEIEARGQLRAERQQVYTESQQHIEALQNEITQLESAVKTAEDEIAKLTTARDDVQQKLEGVSLGYLPGPKATAPYFGFDWQPKIPRIQQIVLEEFDRNNFDKPVARVDRCMSCHAGINKPGFEDQTNPWKTHPHRELLLTKHPPEKFGCTPCHGGQAPAVNSPETAHGNFVDEHGHLENVEFIERPLLRGEKTTAQCIKCHAGVQNLETADEIGRGERLFEQLGCHGCHLTEGYEDLAKSGGVTSIAPSLRRIGAKVDHGWLIRWITNPHQFRPRTRMPNFMFEEEQAVQIAAFLLSDTKQPSEEWLAAHPAPAAAAGTELAAKGKALVESIGCRGCHAITEDEVAGQLGANKDIAPNLAKVAEKTDARWIYHWLKNPRGYSPVARMPSLRLSDDEARAITAYLVTLGTKRPAPDALETRLTDVANAAAGEKLVRKYGCAGCHDVPGMENESRIGVEQPTFAPPMLNGEGEKVQADWLFNFVKAPVPIRPWLQLRMPTFGLADEEANTVVGYFEALDRVQVPFVHLERAALATENVEAGKLLTSKDYFDCFSCHQRGAVKPQGPPEGWAPDLALAHARLGPEWIIKWLRDPQKVMPGTKMPSFFPGGPPDVLGGDDEAQIRALRDYILSLGMPEPSPQQAAHVVTGGPGTSQ